jgi:ribosomal protein S18 acetylase RimI-like enzyme
MAGSGHVKKMARRAEARHGPRGDPEAMRTRYVDGITIRPLRNGDTEPIAALFARLSRRSVDRRFGGPKPCLSARDLEALSRVDVNRHVLVGYVEGDPDPAAMAELVRVGPAAEIAFAVADVYQGRGIASVLARELAADARAAGIIELHASVAADNPAAFSLVRRLAESIRVTWHGSQRELVARLEP